MKIIATFLALLIFASPAYASDEDIRKDAQRWEIAFLALSAIDAAQTCDALGRGIGYELNPILGKHPSCGEVIAFKAATGAIHYFLFRRQLERNPKNARLMAQISTGVQGVVVGLNFRHTF